MTVLAHHQRPTVLAASTRVVASFMSSYSNPFAVDSPEGVNTDMEHAENLQWDNQVIDAEFESGGAAKLQASRLEFANSPNVVAVDSPDGMSDAEVMDNLQWEKEVLDHAAKHEDFTKVHEKHRADQQVREEQARDPERDW